MNVSSIKKVSSTNSLILLNIIHHLPLMTKTRGKQTKNPTVPIPDIFLFLLEAKQIFNDFFPDFWPERHNFEATKILNFSVYHNSFVLDFPSIFFPSEFRICLNTWPCTDRLVHISSLDRHTTNQKNDALDAGSTTAA